MSPDSTETHEQFRNSLSLPFVLVSDASGEIGRLYDVKRRLGLGTSRITYLIDKGGVIKGIYHHELRIGRHVENVLKGLRALEARGD